MTYKKRGIIIFLDILGTKSMINEEAAVSFLNKLDNLFELLDEYSSGIKKLKKFFNTNDSNYVFRKDPHIKKTIPFKDLIGFINSFNIEISTFSDTIIIAVYSDELDIEDAFIIQLSGLLLVPLIRLAFKMELFLKGTISIGDFYIRKKENNKTIIVGPAITEAAESYTLSNWIGISTSPSASLTLEQDPQLNEFKSLVEILDISLERKNISLNDSFHLIFNVFVRENIPRKNGIEKDGWALAWPLFYNNEVLNTDIENILQKNLDYKKFQTQPVTDNIYMKMKNTNEFYYRMIRNNDVKNLDDIIPHFD